MIKVYEFQFADGRSFGCGSELEFNHWKADGVFAADAKLGPVICEEPASEDERRKAAWLLAA